jgi:hypothetical protein
MLSDDQSAPGKVQMNKSIRKKLYIFLGNTVNILSCSDCPACTRVAILPFKDIVEGLSDDLFDTILKPYIGSIYCPIRKLETVPVSAGIRTIEFQITECEPGEYCSVTLSTEIHTEGEPLEHKGDDKADIGSDDIGGWRRQLGLLRGVVPG